MRKTTTLLVGSLFVALSFACHRERANTNDVQPTQTIAPAAAKPDQSGTGDAMTQTVEVDDSRSEGEGATAAPAKTTTAKTSKAAPAKHKKK